MSNYLDSLNESKKLQKGGEYSYLYGSSQDRYQPSVHQSSMNMASSSPESSGGSEAAGGADVGQAAASGAMMGGPAGAAVAVGGSFLSNYLAQKAADERARRDRAAQIEQSYAQNQNQGFDTMMRAAQGALR